MTATITQTLTARGLRRGDVIIGLTNKADLVNGSVLSGKRALSEDVWFKVETAKVGDTNAVIEDGERKLIVRNAVELKVARDVETQDELKAKAEKRIVGQLRAHVAAVETAKQALLDELTSGKSSTYVMEWGGPERVIKAEAIARYAEWALQAIEEDGMDVFEAIDIAEEQATKDAMSYLRNPTSSTNKWRNLTHEVAASGLHDVATGEWTDAKWERKRIAEAPVA